MGAAREELEQLAATVTTREACARLLLDAREAWPDDTDPSRMPARLAKVTGDFCGAIRDFEDALDPRLPLRTAADPWDVLHLEAAREGGNLLLMAARYLDGLGISLVDAVMSASEAQHARRDRRRGDRPQNPRRDRTQTV